MSATTPPQKFFVAGGTLRADAPSYVKRPADDELRQHIETGELCYVLTTRQMGKSSLMARTAAALREEDGYHTAIIDLTSIGQAPANKWYLSFLDELESQLPLSSDVEEWWEHNSALSHVRRFTKFFHEVLAQEVEGRVVIFVDEIDSILGLDFADDFFAAIRSLYNRDSHILQERRLSFVLLGVAAPNDLIKDRTRTPFNIGSRIDLNELSLAEAGVLLQGLPEHDQSILKRIFYWTNGHPYLTQKLGEAIARSDNRKWSDAAVDDLVTSLFFTDEAVAKESNLQFVGQRVAASNNKGRLLRLYRDVYRDKPVASVEQSPYQNELKLYGLIHSDENNRLAIRNRIYKEVFDKEWIKENDPDDPWKRAAVIAIAVVAFALLVFAYYWQQRPEPDDILAAAYTAGFQETTNPTLRLSNLANLVSLEGYTDEALNLFKGLSTDEQVALFENATADLLPQVRHLVSGIYTTLYVADFHGPDEATTRVLQAMLDALGQAQDAESRALRDEIRIWLEGRDYAAADEYLPARIAYDLAIGDNAANPATRLERALILVSLAEYDPAIEDLASAWEYGPPWSESVIARVNGDGQLLSAVYRRPDPPPFIAQLPTATPTATATATTTATATATPTATTTPTTTPAPTGTATARPSATPSRTATATSTATATPPLDSDGDGVIDSSDRCPTTPGAFPDGCPPATNTLPSARSRGRRIRLSCSPHPRVRRRRRIQTATAWPTIRTLAPRSPAPAPRAAPRRRTPPLPQRKRRWFGRRRRSRRRVQ